jgi:hypothetical protein
MTPDVEQRYHPRVPVQWPTVFFTPHCYGHGTVVDVSPLAWRIRGSMPVRVGMQLAVLVWPHGFRNLAIEEATVLWARAHEFALEIYQVRSEDIPEMDRLQEETMGYCPGRRPSAVSRLLSCRTIIPASLRRAIGQILSHCHVRYWWADGQRLATAEGLLHDVSMTGCSFLATAPLYVGQVITIILHFNDGEPPICLPGTSVCWASRDRFGAKFPPLTSQERERLQAVMPSTSDLGPEPETEQDVCRIGYAPIGPLAHWPETTEG